MSGFFGQYQTTMDEKGRITLPAKLRAVVGRDSRTPLLDGNLVITKGLEGCLSLYPEPEWANVQSRLSDLNFTQKDFRYFSRRFYSAAGAVVPDKNGRFLIPSHLISEAGLQKELLVIGVNSWVEIWNPQRYEYYLDQYGKSYEEVAERLFSRNGSERPE